ncbi:MAG: EAL domain-containing protein [Hyphomicrobiaceae bacterium]
MFSYRHKLLATILGSFAVSCAAIAACFYIVTSKYSSALERYDTQYIAKEINRQVAQSAWERNARRAATLAQEFLRETQIGALIENNERSRIVEALARLWDRNEKSADSIPLLGTCVVRADGQVLAQYWPGKAAADQAPLKALIGDSRAGNNRNRTSRVWTLNGRPVMTVLRPVGGAHPAAYILVHVDPLAALEGLGMAIGARVTLYELDGKTLLASLEASETDPSIKTHSTDVVVNDPDGKPIMMARLVRDVTERAATLEAVQMWSIIAMIGIILVVALACCPVVLMLASLSAREQANERCRIAMDNLPQGLLMFDADEKISVVNDSLIRMYGLSPQIAKPGCSFIDFLTHRVETGHLDRNPSEYRAEILTQLASGGVPPNLLPTADGRFISLVNKRLDNGGWIVTHEDVTERVHIEAQLAHMAHHDALTDLPNRAYFGERIQQALNSRRDNEQRWAVLLLDLDRFKEINDTLGHSVGDLLLQEVASRLKSSVRDGDTVARLGGDEFVVLQKLPQDDFEAVALARRLVEAMKRPFGLMGHQCLIGTSVGIALIPKDGTDVDGLLKKADLALYRAKSEGRGTYHFFEPSLDERIQARRRLERDLRLAIGKAQFELVYQPICNLKSGKISAFEALLRWNRPGCGQLAPGEFIPLAEETGIIVEIGNWVLKSACETARNWPAEIDVSVNVSAVQFKNRNFVDSVVEALRESGLEAARLELELTEAAVLDEADGADDTFRRLRELGVKMALDDFGTGYCSLTSLRKHPFHKIKIDRSFVKDLANADGDAEAIVRLVVGLGLCLGLATTAEGVENQCQLDLVRAMGCCEAQGYFLSPPRPVSELAGMLARPVMRERDAA